MRQLLRSLAWPIGLYLLAGGIVTAEHQTAGEQEVQAAFLFQFGRYVEWPATQKWSSDAFTICLLGADPFGAVIDDTIKNKTIGGAPIIVKRIAGATDARDCRILFISASEEDRLPAILRGLGDLKALTVGDGTQFTRHGGMIAFTHEDRKLRFVVNLAAADAAGLRLSSQLLRLAATTSR